MEALLISYRFTNGSEKLTSITATWMAHEARNVVARLVGARDHPTRKRSRPRDHDRLLRPCLLEWQYRQMASVRKPERALAGGRAIN